MFSFITYIRKTVMAPTTRTGPTALPKTPEELAQMISQQVAAAIAQHEANRNRTGGNRRTDGEGSSGGGGSTPFVVPLVSIRSL